MNVDFILSLGTDPSAHYSRFSDCEGADDLGRICIDGFNIALPRGTGIATYGRNLVEAADQIGHRVQIMFGPSARRSSDNIANEAALLNHEISTPKLRRKDRFVRDLREWSSRWGRTVEPITPSNEVIWPNPLPVEGYWAAQDLFKIAQRRFVSERQFTRIRFRGDGGLSAPDVMHWTTPMPLVVASIPNIYTIHDLIPVRLPHTTLHDRDAFLALHKAAVEKADHVAVISETTRQDVVRILGVPEDRVTNTYQAIPRPETGDEVRINAERQIESTFSLEWKRYFLHFGAVEPKKNLGRIVEAYLACGVQTPLVVVGGPGWLGDDELILLKQFRRHSARKDRIQFLEYVSRPMLMALIRGAKATLFPSLYEGFGLPVLESMAVSTAVLTSSSGSLREVAGKAAIFVDPHDTVAIARGILALDSDEDLRSALEDAGLEQAAHFSPVAYQNRLREMYAKVGVTV